MGGSAFRAFPLGPAMQYGLLLACERHWFSGPAAGLSGSWSARHMSMAS